MRGKWVWVATGLVVAVAVLALTLPKPGPALATMTCDQLTAEMLKMTGASPTEEYNVDRVQAINHQRERKGCPL